MSQFTVQQNGEYTIIEFTTASLMDRIDLEKLAGDLYRLIDEQDRRKIVLDFDRVQYLSSQAIGILLNMHKKLSSLKKSKLVLCGVGPRLMELLKITRLDLLFTVTPTQREATN